MAQSHRPVHHLSNPRSMPLNLVPWFYWLYKLLDESLCRTSVHGIRAQEKMHRNLLWKFTVYYGNFSEAARKPSVHLPHLRKQSPARPEPPLIRECGLALPLTSLPWAGQPPSAGQHSGTHPRTSSFFPQTLNEFAFPLALLAERSDRAKGGPSWHSGRGAWRKIEWLSPKMWTIICDTGEGGLVLYYLRWWMGKRAEATWKLRQGNAIMRQFLGLLYFYVIF